MHPQNQTLHPARALLTPTWLGALALLVANDHWLKGSGLLPGVLTGKLSDFAGLLVAPTLLAMLLRVDSRRGLLACHIAVGAVFAGIQISIPFADLWSALMGLVGHPWVITSDLTDLLALPFLWVSWRSLIPAMDPERPALVGLRRSAVAFASVFGLWATVATSDDDGGGSLDEGCCGTDTGGWETDGNEWENVEGQVYIHNPNEVAINLNIRTLRDDVVLDCAAIASDPGRLLPDEAFADAVHWELPPTTNVAVSMPLSCGAAKIAGEGIPEQIIFSSALGWIETFPGSHGSLTELQSQGAALQLNGFGLEWIGGEQWRHTPTTDTVPQGEECSEDKNERHLDWSELPAFLVAEVLSLTNGLDGCHEIELLPWAGANYGEAFTWYLCAPESSIRFEVGEFYQIESFDAFTSSSATVEARLVDSTIHTVLVDDLGRGLRTLVFQRGLSDVVGLPVGVQAFTSPTCPWNVADDCLEVARKLELQLGEGTQVLPGLPAVHVDANGMRHELTLGRARALALTAGECGSASLPYDIDYALVSEPNL
jgi:hypothetical protein